MSGLDWQDADPTAYDPDNPLALLEKAAVAEADRRVMEAVRAVRSMVAAGADAGAMLAARDYVRRHIKALGVAGFDGLAREARKASGEDPGRAETVSAATALVELAQERYTFGVSYTGEPFGVPSDGPKVVAMLRGGKTSLRALLAREYFTGTGRPATQQALADALLVIEGMAQDEDESRSICGPPSTRVRCGLTSATTPAGPSGSPAAGGLLRTLRPVLFKRTSLTGPLPEPQRGGSISDLWDWLNVTEDDRPLVAAALVARCSVSSRTSCWRSSVSTAPARPPRSRSLSSSSTRARCPSASRPGMPTRGSPRRPGRGWSGWTTSRTSRRGCPTRCAAPRPATATSAASSTPTATTRCSRSGAASSSTAIDVGALAPDLADRTVPITLT